MISTVIANLGVWAELVLLIIAIAFVGLAVVLSRGGRRGRRLAGAGAAAMLLIALGLAFAPESGGRAAQFCAVGWPPTLDRANVVLLLPVALLATVATRRPLPVLAALTGASAATELLQALVPALGRSCDLNDWTMNTIGAAAGVLIGAVSVAWSTRRAHGVERAGTV